jgi:branched-chain amino acid transport system substrate-binding protein
MKRIYGAIMATLLVGTALAVTACGSSSSSTSTSSTTSASTGVTSASTEYGLKYTGGKEGAANASLEPVEIGFVNQQGGTPAFPELEKGSEAAVQFINAKLGGIAGHPVKLVKCAIQSEEDGQKCAAQLLGNKKISITSWGDAVVGNGSFYKTVNAKFPTLLALASAPQDYTERSIYSLDAGGQNVIAAMGIAAKEAGYKNVSIISSNNAAGKFVTAEVLVPQLTKAGVKSKAAYVSDTATTPEFASALESAGATSSEAILLIPPGGAQCNATYDAMKQLSIKSPVITVFACYGEEVVEHTNGGPEGWSMYGLNENQRINGEQSNVFRNVMSAYGDGGSTNVGGSPRAFGDMLTIAKLANAIGPAKLSAAEFEKQIHAFMGPMFMVPGQIKCGANPTLKTVCGDSVAGSTYKSGKWEPLKSIQTTKLG